MKLNPNSWFVKKFLGCDEDYLLPRTVCELGRKILSRSLLFAFAAGVAALVVVPVILTLVGFGLVSFTDSTFAGVFLSEEPQLYPVMFGITCIYVSGVLLVGAVWLIVGLGVRVRYKMQRRRYYYREPGVVVQFSKGMWARFKDKTCVMIDYDTTEQTRKEELRRMFNEAVDAAGARLENK